MRSDTPYEVSRARAFSENSIARGAYSILGITTLVHAWFSTLEARCRNCQVSIGCFDVSLGMGMVTFQSNRSNN